MGAGEPAPAPGGSDFEKGYEAYQRGQFAKALDLWEPLARAGDLRAQYNIGLIYAQGRGVRRNEAKALELWTRAAENGHVRAMHNLALANIAGVPGAKPGTNVQNFDAALKWLKKASNQDFPHSLYALGNLYRYGLGVKKDEGRAAALFRQSAQKGSVRAQYTLARVYRDGSGVKRDMAEALKWCLLASRRGNEEAREALDDMILNAGFADLREAAERAEAFETARGGTSQE